FSRHSAAELPGLPCSKRGILIRLLKIVLCAAVVASAGLYYVMRRPYAGFRDEVFIEIPKGASTRAMAKSLADAGVVQFPWAFLAVRALRPGWKLQAGEYRFAARASVFDVFSRIARG